MANTERDAHLDHQARKLLALLAAGNAPPFSAVGPTVARKMHAALVRMLAGPAMPVELERDFEIPGPGGALPIRLYAPARVTEPAPVLVYFHGGGNVVGDLEMTDATCRALAREADCVVLNVDYRLAPEHPYPAALEDAYAAVLWVAEHAAEIGGDGTRIAVGGDSAGGTLSALVCRLSRDRGGPPIVFQALVYAAGDVERDYPSMREYAEGYLISAETIRWFRAQYFGGRPPDGDDYAWPLRAPSLAGLPPALVITAGFDPLQDSGNAYGEALRAAGVPVRFLHYDGMVHGFFVYPHYFDRAREAIGEVAASLRTAFTNSGAIGGHAAPISKASV
jgi:acetyl esterase